MVEGETAIVIGAHTLRVLADSLAEIFDRTLEVAALEPRKTTIVIGVGKARIAIDGLVVIADGGVVIRFGVPRIAAILVNLRAGAFGP